MRNKMYTLFTMFVALNFTVSAQEIAITGNQYHLYGPNATWGQYLQVGGNGQATGHAFVATTNGNLHLDSKAGFATYINYYNQGNTYLNVQAGNVGVGTTAPATKFEVMQSTSGWTMNSRVNAATAGEINGLKLYSGYIGEDKWAGISSVAESQHSNKTGLALYSGMIERMRISGDGSVGIGNTAPEEKLDISGNIRFDRLRSSTAVFNYNSRNSLNSFNDGKDVALSPGWIAVDLGGNDNASDRLVIGTGYGGKAVIGTHNHNLTAWGGDLLINPTGGGNVAIGTTSARERLSVNGRIRAVEIKVEATNWPDYVFEENYKVETLEGLESFIKANKHLPEMPTAKDVSVDGIALGEMNKLLLKKVEELTLHLIEKDHQINNQQKKMDVMEKDLQEIKFFMKNKPNEKN